MITKETMDTIIKEEKTVAEIDFRSGPSAIGWYRLSNDFTEDYVLTSLQSIIVFKLEMVRKIKLLDGSRY